MEAVKTKDAPEALGPYSQAVVANGFVYTAGQIPVDPVTGEIPESIEDQTHQALSNVMAILTEAGDTDVVSVTVYLTDMSDFAKVNEVYSRYFREPFPARSCVEVSKLPKGVRIEISAIAALHR